MRIGNKRTESVIGREVVSLDVLREGGGGDWARSMGLAWGENRPGQRQLKKKSLPKGYFGYGLVERLLLIRKEGLGLVDLRRGKKNASRGCRMVLRKRWDQPARGDWATCGEVEYQWGGRKGGKGRGNVPIREETGRGRKTCRGSAERARGRLKKKGIKGLKNNTY